VVSNGEVATEVAMSDEESLARAAIGALHEAFGEHEGRVVHVKGGWAEATFTATPEGGALCRAPFLQGQPVRALVRFSNGGGNPHHPDWAPDPRGLAVKFYLPDGSRTDIVAVSSPLFPTRTPEGFVELIAAQGAGAAAAFLLVGDVDGFGEGEADPAGGAGRLQGGAGGLFGGDPGLDPCLRAGTGWHRPVPRAARRGWPGRGGRAHGAGSCRYEAARAR